MKSLTLFGALAASLLATHAFAEDVDYPNLMSRIGLTAEAGGGVGGFLDSRAVDATTAAGVWDARLTIGSRMHFAGEIGYTGSAQTMNTLGVENNSKFVGNGVEGAFRFNLLTGMWQPYAIAGLGWTHYNVTGTAFNTSDFASSENVVQFPLGAGLAWRYQGFVADARFAFHPAAGTEINLSTWDVAGRLGFEF